MNIIKRFVICIVENRCLTALWNGYLKNKNKLYYEERGHPMAVYANDAIGQQIHLEGVYEKRILYVVFKFLSSFSDNFSKSTVLDIGANIGNHSLYFSNHFNSVLSFEPHPDTYKLLDFNASFRPNIKVYNFGCSNTDGTCLLYVGNMNNMGGASIIKGENSKKAIEIKLKKIDQMAILSKENVSLIKIDVEKHEFEVISGAVELINRNRPIILFEQSASEFEGDTTKTISLIRSMNYEIYEINSFPNKWRFFKVFLKRNHYFISNSITKRDYDVLIAIPSEKTLPLSFLPIRYYEK